MSILLTGRRAVTLRHLARHELSSSASSGFGLSRGAASSSCSSPAPILSSSQAFSRASINSSLRLPTMPVSGVPARSFCSTSVSTAAPNAPPTPPAKPAAAKGPQASPSPSSSSSSSATGAGGTYKPRAEAGQTMKRKGVRWWLVGSVGGAVASAGYYLYSTGSERPDSAALNPLAKMRVGLQDTMSSLSAYFESLKETKVNDPTPDDFLPILRDVPDHAISVLLALDDLLLRRDWHPKYGWRIELRPGVKEFFREMQAAGCIITLWGEESSNTAVEVVNKMSLEFGFPLAITPLHLGSEHCFVRKEKVPITAAEEEAERKKAGGGGGGGGGGSKKSAEEELGLVSKAFAAIDKLLGGDEGKKEGADGSGGMRMKTVTVKEKHLEFFGASHDPKTILLVDTDPRQAKLNPENTFVVKSWKAYEEEAQDAASRGTPQHALPRDDTLKAIIAVCERIKTDASNTGRIDVPRSLARLRRDAMERGFSPDASGIYNVVRQIAAEGVEMERMRRETGLGGALRKTVDRIPTLKGKGTVLEMAESKIYRDPAVDAGTDDTLLARKVHAAVKPMEDALRQMRRGAGGGH